MIGDSFDFEAERAQLVLRRFLGGETDFRNAVIALHALGAGYKPAENFLMDALAAANSAALERPPEATKTKPRRRAAAAAEEASDGR